MVRPTPLIILGLSLLLGGCDVSMTQQPKYETYAPSRIWPGGGSARGLPKGVVPQEQQARDQAAANPPPVTEALLARGQDRYDIYCSPCHGIAGDADGIVVKHGFPAPPSYFSAALLQAPASTFYDTITNGYGVMYAYADRVSPHDRWAIVAYIRALQLSRHTQVADDPQAREHLP